MIKSVIEIGDIIQCEICGIKETVEVKDFKVIYNHPVIRPIELIIYVTLKDRFGSTEWSFTSDNIKIIKHLNPHKEAAANKLD